MRRRKRSFRREAAQIAQQSSARAKRSGRKAPRGTGTDARPSGSRTAGRPSAPPGRGQAAMAVFRRGGMSRIRRMRGPPQAGRESRRQARTTQERPNAPAPTARDFAPEMRRRKRSFRRAAAQIAQQSSARAKRSGRKEPRRRTDAAGGGARCGRSRSQSGDWREMRRRKRSFRREAAQIA